MEIILVRHGQPGWNRGGVAVVNPDLTALGQLQARRAAEALADETFDEVLVSPLRRARETAAPILSALGREEQIATWLREWAEPETWHGLPSSEVDAHFTAGDKRPPADRWHGFAGGESVRDFTDRIRRDATEFLSSRGVVRRDDDYPVWEIAQHTTIGLVAHVGTNACVIGLLLGIDPTPWEWDRFAMSHASITRLVSKPASGGHIFMLTNLSNEEHLADDQTTR